MITIYQNIGGTTVPNFKIGKHGSRIHSMDNFPSDIVGDDGDWCLTKNGNPQLLKKVSGTWKDVNTRNISTVTESGTHVLVSSQDVILLNGTNITYTIDAAIPKGYTITLKDISGNSSTNPITIQGSNGVTFDDMSSITIDGDFSSITLLSDGSNYYII